MNSNTQWVDPFRAFNFKLQIQGVTEGHFMECGGLGITVEKINYREAGDSQLVHRLPGKVDYSDVTLKYGLTKSTNLWDWFMKGVKGTTDRRHVSIILLNSEGNQPVTQWNLQYAWPTEWKAAELNTMGNEVAIESVTLTFESVERVNVGS